MLQAFVNSLDLESGVDAFTDPIATATWLMEHGFPAGDRSLTIDDVRLLIDTREALRALLIANGGGPLDPAAVALLNRRAAEAPLVVRLDPAGGAALLPAGAGVDQATGRLLAIMYAAMLDGTWPRLKACRRVRCAWAFYDASKNRSGAWCSMAVCGNRTKVQNYQQRTRAARRD